MKTKSLVIVCALLFSIYAFAQKKPVKIGVIGLTHTHVHWIFGSEKSGDFTIAGIVEQNKNLAQQYAAQYGFPMSMVYNTNEELLNAQEMDAVTAFGTIYDHLRIVETFAPLGIHVMVEKPLAVSLKHAKKMEALAKKYNIHLLTNYETTWYPTNHKAYELVNNDGVIGTIKKIIVRDGHKGPKKIGVNIEFLEWLIDPKLNGGGAITDFGCYGANLSTWLMNGKKPNSVTAITQQQQKENNPLVDDEAIILLDYGKSVTVIQASWNWPIGRKDMEIYGEKGAVYSDNRHDLRIRISKGYDGFTQEVSKLEEREEPLHDPFSYFASVIRNEIEIERNDLSSLENNLVVMEILEAAKKSARTNKSVFLKK